MTELDTSDLKHKLVLVVDDDPESRLLLTQYLETLGCEVITARTGQQGIYNAHTFQPDLVVLDVNLPDMSGWEVLATLRKDPATSHLKTVVVSGSSELGERAIVEGLDAVSKPVNPIDLFEAVQRNIRQSDGRVLIIDDSEDDRTLLAGFLEPHVEEVRTARDGEEAFKLLEAFDAELILLDLVMPRMDGFAFLEKLRSDPRYAAKPVLVITGKKLTEEETSQVRRQSQGLVGKSGSLSKAIRKSLHSLIAPEETSEE